MRTLAKISIPVEAGNAAIKDGTLPKIIGETMEKLKPEAAYFGALGGQRTALLVFDLKDSSDLPPLLEPFFLHLHAQVEISPCMSADDLMKGMKQLQGG